MTYLLKCQSCDEILERPNNKIAPRCFTCKKILRDQRYLELSPQEKKAKFKRNNESRLLRKKFARVV